MLPKLRRVFICFFENLIRPSIYFHVAPCTQEISSNYEKEIRRKIFSLPIANYAHRKKVSETVRTLVLHLLSVRCVFNVNSCHQLTFTTEALLGLEF